MVRKVSKIVFATFIILLVNISLVGAITQQEINEAKGIIDSKTDCKNLADSQLEILGEYYMEQMHPGESHGLMHKMMGLNEGSESEKQFHINMARAIYCSEASYFMGSRGMMSMMGYGQGNNAVGSSMMGGLGFGPFGIVWFAIISFVFSIVFWLTYRWLVGNKRR
ncbi:MAG: hypothetical protein AABW88_00765 [Nanoarchaeota archaeon]